MLYNFCMLILEGWALIFSLISLIIFLGVTVIILGILFCFLIVGYDNLYYWIFKKPTKIGDWLYEKLGGDD